MNALLIIIPVILLFIFAYLWYGKKLELIWAVDPKKPTPAYTKFDSIDYIPAKNWLVLFGHHFSSIAGAGPIIGPVIAVMLWGWLPALLWVVLGTIFIGGIHDFGSLMTSVREGGSSIADIAKHAISARAKIFFSLFVWLALILVISVFAYLCADTFIKEPKIVIPSLGLIPIAMLVGYLLYNLRINTILVTLFGLISLTALLFLGDLIPVNSSLNIWIAVLFIYCFFASVLPVNILLQPRDYLSSFLLFFGVIAGYLGLFLSPQVIKAPYYHKFVSSEGYLWPMLFITVACGSISGFHSLIASGTSSKQIANERFAKRIGYGGMIAEGMVAVLAIIAAALIFNNKLISLKGISPIAIFGEGYSIITEKILVGQGKFIAITILNAFILTTLDTATRISRYLTEELFRIKSRYLSTFIIVVLSAALTFSGKWNKIWPAFGASNQLVAALALFVLTCWLLGKGKKTWFVLWPGVFMLFTTLAALIIQAIKYFLQKDFILLITVILLIALAIFMTYEVLPIIITRRKQHA